MADTEGVAGYGCSSASTWLARRASHTKIKSQHLCPHWQSGYQEYSVFTSRTTLRGTIPLSLSRNVDQTAAVERETGRSRQKALGL